MKRLTYILAVVLFLLLSGAAVGQAPLDPQIREQYFQASVRVSNTLPSGKSFGSGTVIDSTAERSIVLTCEHLFREGVGNVQVDIFWPEPAKHRATILARDRDRDLALLSIAPGTLLPVVPIARKGQFTLSNGTKCFTVGCPRAQEPQGLPTEICGFGSLVMPHIIQVSGGDYQGHSGGGLFLDGYLIGVATTHDSDTGPHCQFVSSAFARPFYTQVVGEK